MSRLICLAMLALVAAVAITAAPHEDFSQEHVVEVAEECKTEAGATEGQCTRPRKALTINHMPLQRMWST